MPETLTRASWLIIPVIAADAAAAKQSLIYAFRHVLPMGRKSVSKQTALQGQLTPICFWKITLLHSKILKYLLYAEKSNFAPQYLTFLSMSNVHQIQSMSQQAAAPADFRNILLQHMNDECIA